MEAWCLGCCEMYFVGVGVGGILVGDTCMGVLLADRRRGGHLVERFVMVAL